MRGFIRLGVVVFCGLIATVDAQAQLAETFSQVRSALAGRDIEKATELLSSVKTMVPEASAEEFERLELLTDYSKQFWTAVWRGAQTLRGTDELVVGETRTAVVESRPNSIILRIAGRNRTFSTNDMPASLALKLASLALKVDAPENQVIVGAFHAVDAKGDRAKAAAYWDKAIEAGVDVAYLKAELATAKAAPVSSTEIPQLTPALRSLLKESNWKTMKKDGERWVRLPLNGTAANNEEGRLDISAPADEDVIVVFQRGQTGNFRSQMVLSGLSGKESLVLVSDGPEAIEVPLPAGAVLAELTRLRRVVNVQLNSKKVDVGEVLSNGSGYIGVRVPAGGECTIAAFLAQ